ncbi:radical SAM protein [Bacillus cereus group sp. BfR-BA-01538]|uniref:B12-binding domain-containing radical SAM protein n=1 Tax=Bacillus cereus group sp. BfR-BA-01538 TaxID=2920373 RepID=UPI001F5A2084
MNNQKKYEKDSSTKKEKLLLALMPYWTPLIPPMGIGTLKGFIASHGYDVKIADANIEAEFKNIYNIYFEELGKYIPEHKGRRGNHFYNVGHNVLHDHMLAYINKVNEQEFIKLIKKIVHNTYYHELTVEQIHSLNSIIGDFYAKLEKYVLTLIETEEPTVVGLSVYKHTFAPSLFAFQVIKKYYPEIVTVMGGGIFTQTLSVGSSDLEYFLEETERYIDKVIIGEGEYILLKILNGDLPSDKRVITLQDINRQTVDLSTAPLPDFTDLDIKQYPLYGVYVSRGCPFKCSFCAETVIWDKFRIKSAQGFVEELKDIYESYGRQFFWTCDSLVNPMISNVSKEIIKSGLPVYWDGYLRADKPVGNIENTMLWRRGGFYKARMGVESGSQRVLNLMDKRITVEQIKAAVSALAYAGIKTTTYWIIGYPGETDADFELTLKLVEEIKDDIYEAMCEPFYFFMSGQVNSDEWVKKNNVIPVYTEQERKMLITQTYVMDSYPSAEIRHKRINRFVEHCEKLGIPTPYSVNEITNADERWKKLHKNAVPSMIEFMSGNKVIDEKKNIRHLIQADNSMLDEGDFAFI